MPHLADSVVEKIETGSPAARSCESAVTIVAGAVDGGARVLARMRDAIPRGTAPLAVFLFGRREALAGARSLFSRDADACEWPLLAVEGRPCHDGNFAGAQAYVAPIADVRRIHFDGRVLGSVFDDGVARHCVLAGVGPGDTTRVPAEQTQETFENLEAALAAGGFCVGDLVRTWFYNHRILDWYGEFNRVRAAFYGDVDFRLGEHPSSTGIEGNPLSGAALALAAWAVQPSARGTNIAAVNSPLQCPAPRYGSLFSRAAAMRSSKRERIFVSGTASIAPGGESIWPGDAPRQIDQTMRVIEALLATRKMVLADIDRALAYFKNAADVPRFTAWLRVHGLDGLPFIPMQCDVCRDDLLFELEADAMRPAQVRQIVDRATLTSAPF